MVRFRGMQKHTFYFHLKECEFRFNHKARRFAQTRPQNVQSFSSVLVMTLIQKKVLTSLALVIILLVNLDSNTSIYIMSHILDTNNQEVLVMQKPKRLLDLIHN